jgi:hypothetical protein
VLPVYWVYFPLNSIGWESSYSSMDQCLNCIDDERKHLVRENEQLKEYLLRLKYNSMKYNLIFEGLYCFNFGTRSLLRSAISFGYCWYTEYAVSFSLSGTAIDRTTHQTDVSWLIKLLLRISMFVD